ncbi:MAG: porin [Rhizobiaceae bacterium]
MIRTTSVITILLLSSASYAEDGIFLYGHLNYGALHYDDGVDSKHFFVDNNNSNSRVGVDILLPKDDFGQLRFNFETSLGTTLSGSVSQLTGNDFDWDWQKTKLRKFELIYTSNDHGTLYLGQGSMATDGISYSDFSGTTVAATVSVKDTSGGQLFRINDGTLSDVSFGSAVTDFDGSRRFRVRYDTPAVAGFTLSCAYGQEILKDDNRDYVDVALRYAKQFGDFKVRAGAGYNWRSDGRRFAALSAGVLHDPTGLNATIVTGGDNDDATMLYGKLGVTRSLFGDDSYKTAISVDYYSGNDINGTSSETGSFGFAVVQNLGEHVELYGLYRTHDYDDIAGDYQQGEGIFIGARLKFRLDVAEGSFN